MSFRIEEVERLPWIGNIYRERLEGGLGQLCIHPKLNISRKGEDGKGGKISSMKTSREVKPATRRLFFSCIYSFAVVKS